MGPMHPGLNGPGPMTMNVGLNMKKNVGMNVSNVIFFQNSPGLISPWVQQPTTARAQRTTVQQKFWYSKIRIQWYLNFRAPLGVSLCKVEISPGCNNRLQRLPKELQTCNSKSSDIRTFVLNTMRESRRRTARQDNDRQDKTTNFERSKIFKMTQKKVPKLPKLFSRDIYIYIFIHSVLLGCCFTRMPPQLHPVDLWVGVKLPLIWWHLANITNLEKPIVF